MFIILLIMKKIKILFLSSSLENSGPVNVLFNIIKYLDREKMDVTILSLGHSKNKSRKEEFKALVGLNVVELHYKNICQSFCQYFNFMNSYKFDIIHAHCLRSLLFTFLINSNSLKFYTIHIFPGYQTLAIQGKLRGKGLNILSRFLIKRTDVNIACADFLRREIIDSITSHCLSVPNGVEAKAKISVFEKNVLKSKLSLDLKMQYFIFIGRLSVEKRPMFLIENFIKSFPKEYGLIILGDGPLLSQILPFNSERIRVLKVKTNVFDYLVASDFYISASVVEGLANTFLEALSVGLPCLVSNIPSHREVLSGSEEFIGLDFETDDGDDFQYKALCFLEQISKNTKLNVARYFEKYYTAKRMSEDYQKIYISKYTEKKDV